VIEAEDCFGERFSERILLNVERHDGLPRGEKEIRIIPFKL